MPEQKRSALAPSRIFLYGVLIKNPVLVQVIGLCPAVAAAADIYVSAVLSILVTGLLILCECFASLAMKKVPGRIRVAVYFLIGLFVCAQTAYYLEQNAPDLLNGIGIYLPLMAASSAVALRAENFAVKKSVRLAFLDALANGVGTSLVLLTSGFVRGLLGSGMIGEWRVFADPPLRGLAMPFGGFIVLGFGAAALKWFISTFLRQFDAQMEFGIRRNRKKKTAQPSAVPAAQQPDAETAAPDEDGRVPSEESRAAAFYEQESEQSDERTDNALFDTGPISVQDEMDLILASIGTLDDLLPTKEEDDA